jgi:hypothetical protein
MGQQIMIVKKKGGAPAYLVNEDCEGTGTPSGWTDTGTVAWDEATVVLAGSQSLKLVGEAAQPRSTYTAGSTYPEVWVRFKFRKADVTSSIVRILQLKNASTTVAYLRTTSGGAPQIFHGTASANTSGALSSNTNYNIWIHYVAGSGSNGQLSVGFSTTDTEPTSGSNFVSLSTGTATASLDGFEWINTSTNSAHIVYVDSMTVDDQAIGDF